MQRKAERLPLVSICNYVFSIAKCDILFQELAPTFNLRESLVVEPDRKEKVS